MTLIKVMENNTQPAENSLIPSRPTMKLALMMIVALSIGNLGSWDAASLRPSFAHNESETSNLNNSDHDLVIDPKTVTKKCIPDLSIPFFAQYSEDERIYNKFYSADPKCGGVIIEMGGFDGKTFSNSWFFQYALNWKALLVEAFPDNYAKMVVNRPDAINVFGAICPGKSIAFQPGNHGAVGGGAVQDMSNAHKKRFIDGSLALVEVPCMALSDLFHKNGIIHVDVFFLDVEGGELTVLETFDWSVPIDIFVIEMDSNNPQKDEAVRQLLFAHGYVTPFSLLGDYIQATQSDVFVSREIAGRKFVNHEPIIGETNTDQKPVMGEVKTDHKPINGKAVGQGRFSVSLEKTLSERGVNFITAASGCHLAAWVFQGGSDESVVDCHVVPGDVLDIGGYHASQHLDPETVSQIQSYDTIYVNTKGLTDFVETILPSITSPIVLLVGQHRHVIQLIPTETEATLLNSSCIVKLFSQNLGYHFRQPLHPKLAPWPYGILPHHWPLEFLSKAFWRLQNDTNHRKTKGIMHGYLGKTNAKRENIPSGPKLNYTEYYDEIARHRFILSPDGDRPECFRMFEAIGLGTVPITELPSDLYRHLQPAPVLYETSDWNISDTQAMERLGATHFLTVNRLLVLEEYWLDYVQREMGGGNLRWFDRMSLRKAKLDDFQILT
jgi:FkbM family methyltransferase